MAQVEPLMQRNFIEYASYVVMDRAIPDIRDGLKPVQRRILHTLFEMHDGRFHKVANVIGETMKLHPHGDAAISDALVVLGNKDYFIERQGNFGNLLTGHPAAAARYIECRLTALAQEALFHRPTTTFVSSYDGRKDEPLYLPAKLPVLLMLGPEGIAVGMATRVLPHNFGELLRAQINLLRGKDFRLFPDFPQGGIMDVREYADGHGKVVVRAKVAPRGDKKVVITEIPFSVTTESLIASIEAAAQKGQVKIAGINDFTTDRVEIEIELPRGIYAEEVIPQLFAYTDCEQAVHSNIVAIRAGRPEEMSVTQVLASQTDRLLEQIKAELRYEIDQLHDREHWLTLEQIFIEQHVYKRLEKAKTAEAVKSEVWDGMAAFKKKFVRPMTDDDVERLLQIRIRRISAYDIERYRAEMKEVLASIAEREKKLKRLKNTAIQFLEGLLKKHGASYPRRTKIQKFETVDKREVARQYIRVSYDPESGFFGSKVRGEQFSFNMSEYDRVLAICQNGTYVILGPEDKRLMPDKVIWCSLFDPEKGKSFTVVYRDKRRMAFGKKIKIEKFIKNKEYELIKGREGRVDLLIEDAAPGKLHLDFVKVKRQKLKECSFDLNELEPTSPGSRGTRLAPKPVSKVTRIQR